MRFRIVLLGMLFCWVTSAAAQVSIGVAVPGVSIGINVPAYPQLVAVPGYPVYYAPGLPANYFFYDGMYWVYQNDNWYASSWYNGPWGLVAPAVVPLFILRVPVGYYRYPPVYFRGWGWDAPPHWGEHWGHEWEQHRSGWDRWNHSAVPARAPLPLYQRQYSGDRYPRVEQQHALQSQHYHYQPHDTVAREHYQQQETHRSFTPTQRSATGAPPGTPSGTPPGTFSEKNSKQREFSQSNSPPPVRQGSGTVPHSSTLQRSGEGMPKSTTGHTPPPPGGTTVQSHGPLPKDATTQQHLQRSNVTEGNAQVKGTAHDKGHEKGGEQIQEHAK
jgi:hypothetical protein